MDGIPVHEVFPLQVLLISYPVRHISTWTPLFELIPVMPWAWQLHIKIYDYKDNGRSWIHIVCTWYEIQAKAWNMIMNITRWKSGRFKKSHLADWKKRSKGRKSRKVYAPWSTNSWVVWFSCGILNLQLLPAEKVRDIVENVCKYMTVTYGTLFQLD